MHNIQIHQSNKGQEQNASTYLLGFDHLKKKTVTKELKFKDRLGIDFDWYFSHAYQNYQSKKKLQGKQKEKHRKQSEDDSKRHRKNSLIKSYSSDEERIDNYLLYIKKYIQKIIDNQKEEMSFESNKTMLYQMYKIIDRQEIH